MRTERRVIEEALQRLRREQEYRGQVIEMLETYLSLPSLDLRLLIRERLILTVLARGGSNREIARILHLSLSGAKHYVSDLLVRFVAVNRAHLAARFLASVADPVELGRAS